MKKIVLLLPLLLGVALLVNAHDERLKITQTSNAWSVTNLTKDFLKVMFVQPSYSELLYLNGGETKVVGKPGPYREFDCISPEGPLVRATMKRPDYNTPENQVECTLDVPKP